MRNPKFGSLLPLAVVLFLLLTMALPVSAAQEGSLLLSKVEKNVVLYRVADADGVLCGDFSGWGAGPLTQADVTPEKARSMKDYAVRVGIAGQTQTPDGQSQVQYAPLAEGFYLVCSTTQPGEFAPFLLRLPTHINGEAIYHIQATPKTEGTPQPTAPGTSDTPDGTIPQTGYIQWPKYLLLCLGGLLILAGGVQVLRGREERHE